jgi:hypothetical protein
MGSVHAPFDEIYAGMGSHVKGITRNKNGSQTSAMVVQLSKGFHLQICIQFQIGQSL